MLLSPRTLPRFAVLLVLARFAIPGAQSGATLYDRPLTMRESVDKCRYIVAGTVTRSVVVRDTVGSSVMHFTLRDLAFAKGTTEGDSLVVTMPGFRGVGVIVEAAGQSHFEMGGRYICFLADGGTRGLYAGTSYLPLGDDGVYRVFLDRATLQSIVVDASGHFVTGVDSVGIFKSKFRLSGGYKRSLALRDSMISDGAAQTRAAHEAPLSEVDLLTALHQVFVAFDAGAPKAR